MFGMKTIHHIVFYSVKLLLSANYFKISESCLLCLFERREQKEEEGTELQTGPPVILTLAKSLITPFKNPDFY